MAATRSHTLSIGIVGLPNSGKSTLFNSLTKCSVPAENFPFCTIDKNVGVVKIPDKRLDMLAQFFKAQKVVSSAITFVDIAGLVKGASQGEGLGNQFLAHIREVDVVMYVLRAFTGDKVVHVYDRVDPLEDLKIVQSELILKDIDTVNKRLGEVGKIIRTTTNEKTKKMYDFLIRLLAHLGEGKCAIDMSMTRDEYEYMEELWLLTGKKRIYVLNTREGVNEPQFDKWYKDIVDFVPADDKNFVVKMDVKLTGELSNMTEAEAEEYINMYGGNVYLIHDLISLACKRLSLITFYTGSEKEVNAWTISDGANVQESAGVIHTDLAANFITCEVVNVEDLIKAGGWIQAKERGIVKSHGKDYLTLDGDYIIAYEGSSKKR